jgi:hypothetical protein
MTLAEANERARQFGTIGSIERCPHGPREVCRCPNYWKWLRLVASDFDRVTHRFPRVMRRWAAKHGGPT